MKITTAEFVISNTDVNKCPKTGFPEYAFIGRSNVGKSSLINMLTGSKKLAMTSSTPGKTLLINHFLINKQWYLVDLPGYGYANRSKKSVADIQRVIGSYLEKRMEMTCLFVLIDSRLEPQKIDVNFMNWLGENQIPFAIVFTKADKQSKSRTDSNVKVYLDKLKEQWEELPPYFITSSLSGVGKDEMLSYIDSINNTLDKK
jgi:GTP-binding protein